MSVYYDHDRGDEDRSTLGDVCPFCGISMFDRRCKPHATPLANLDKLSRSEADYLADAIHPGIKTVALDPSLKFEVMWTCYECRDQAKRFAREQRRTTAEKWVRAHKRDIERRDGMIGVLLPVDGSDRSTLRETLDSEHVRRAFDDWSADR